MHSRVPIWIFLERCRWHAMVLAVLYFTHATVAIASPEDPIARFRKWVDSTGKFEVEAKFVEVRDGKIVLERKDREVIRVDHQRLSKGDQLYVAEHLQKALTASREETAVSKRSAITGARTTPPEQAETVKAVQVFKDLTEITADSEKELYGIRWIESHEEAEEIALETNKPIMWFRVLGDLEGFM